MLTIKPKKLRWSVPRLTVLVHRYDNEAVLSSCKTGGSSDSGPVNYHLRCRSGSGMICVPCKCPAPS